MAAWLRRFHGNDQGASALEFALLLPVLVLILVGLVDFGVAYKRQMQLEHAARAAIHQAIHDVRNTGAITQAALGSGLPPAVLAEPSLSVATASFCECSAGTAITCGLSCADGAPARLFVAVTVAYAHETLFPYPFLSDPIRLEGRAEMRVR